MESFINKIMYEVPSDPNVEKCIITPGCVRGKADAKYVYRDNRVPIKKEKEDETKIS